VLLLLLLLLCLLLLCCAALSLPFPQDEEFLYLVM
jgi:hypothetical protein